MIYIKLYIICYTITDVISAVSTMAAYGGGYEAWGNYILIMSELMPRTNRFTHTVSKYCMKTFVPFVIIQFSSSCGKVVRGLVTCVRFIVKRNAITTEQKRPPDSRCCYRSLRFDTIRSHLIH